MTCKEFAIEKLVEIADYSTEPMERMKALELLLQWGEQPIPEKAAA